MVEEAYQIKDYFHDAAVAFAGAMNPKGRLAHNEDEIYSSDRYKLESCNPEDTIPVATFFYEKYSPKKAYFYVASFRETQLKDSHMEVYSLFSIWWNKEWSHWKKIPEYCCSVIFEKPQPPLHKEATNWMIQKMTAEGCAIAPLDVFKNGKLEILI